MTRRKAIHFPSAIRSFILFFFFFKYKNRSIFLTIHNFFNNCYQLNNNRSNIFENLAVFEFKFARDTLDLIRPGSVQRALEKPYSHFVPRMSDKNEHISRASGIESTGGFCTVSCQINGSKMARGYTFSLCSTGRGGKKRTPPCVADKTSAGLVPFATVCRPMYTRDPCMCRSEWQT